EFALGRSIERPFSLPSPENKRRIAIALAHVHRLVQCLTAAKANAAIDAHGWIIVGRHFEKGAAQPSQAETVQRLQKQRACQAATTVGGDNADILDRARAATLTNALNRT